MIGLSDGTRSGRMSCFKEVRVASSVRWLEGR